MEIPERFLERFWAMVDMRGQQECWPWLGVLDKDGYGHFKTPGHNYPAHRIAYFLVTGAPIPEGLQSDHTCHSVDATCAGGNTCLHRRCVNPAHIEPVTALENTRRGRGITAANMAKTHCPKGHPYDEVIFTGHWQRACRTCMREMFRRHYHTKAKFKRVRKTDRPFPVLNALVVVQMREMAASGQTNVCEIARQFSVPHWAARQAIQGATWRHVGGPITPRKKRQN